MTKTNPVVSIANKRERSPGDYLSYADIEREYPGTVKKGTLGVWACTKRYGFDRLITRVGNMPRIRRDAWEQFLASRTGPDGEHREVA